MYRSENDKTMRGSGRVGGAESLSKERTVYIYIYVCVDNKHPERRNK